jgi:hypothetical protein
VAWDKAESKILPFQVLSTRKRKDVKEEDITVRVAVFAFDCLYLNGKVKKTIMVSVVVSNEINSLFYKNLFKSDVQNSMTHSKKPNMNSILPNTWIPTILKISKPF